MIRPGYSSTLGSFSVIPTNCDLQDLPEFPGHFTELGIIEIPSDLDEQQGFNFFLASAAIRNPIAAVYCSRLNAWSPLVVSNENSKAFDSIAALEFLHPERAYRAIETSINLIIDGGSSGLPAGEKAVDSEKRNWSTLLTMALLMLMTPLGTSLVRMRHSKLQLQLEIASVCSFAYWSSSFLFLLMQSFPITLLICAVTINSLPYDACFPLLILSLTLAMVSFVVFLGRFCSGTGSSLPTLISYSYVLSAFLTFVLQILEMLVFTGRSEYEELFLLMLKGVVAMHPLSIFGQHLEHTTQAAAGGTTPAIARLLFFDVYTMLATQSATMLLCALLHDAIVRSPRLRSWFSLAPIWRRCLRKLPESSDEDVAAEKERVLSRYGAILDLIRVEDVVKQYPGTSSPAVGGVSFGVQAGEAFAFLGLNGAGK